MTDKNAPQKRDVLLLLRLLFTNVIGDVLQLGDGVAVTEMDDMIWEIKRGR